MQDKWVVEAKALTAKSMAGRGDGWRSVLGISVCQYENKFAMNPMPLEACLKAALKATWNHAMYSFRFRNVVTGEAIPFEIFPEIEHEENN